MKAKPIIPCARAIQDVDETIERYLEEGSEQGTLGFIDALEQLYTHISRHPAAGSPRHAHELNLPGLRFRALRHYPHFVFYMERSDHIDIWRVLHGQRDVPSWMQEADKSR